MDRKSRLTFGPFCIRGINDNGIYCRAWKKLFRCLYDHDPRPPEAKMGNLSHKKAEAERRKQILDLCQQTKRRKEHEKVETISNLMERYIALYGQTKWSLSTYQSNCGLIRNYILPLLGNIRLEELSPLIVAELYRDFLQQPRYDGPYHKSCGRTVSLSVLREIFTNCCTAHLNRQFYGNTSLAIPFTELFFHAWKPSHVNFFSARSNIGIIRTV